MKYLVETDNELDVIDSYWDAIELGERKRKDGATEYRVYRLTEMAHQNDNGNWRNEPSWEER